jgi:hypothetical protein
MSYFLADANGYVADFANSTRLVELSEWAAERPSVIRRFVSHGFTGSPEQLADEVAEELHSAPSQLQPLLETLCSAARRANEILLVAERIAA